MTKPTPCAGAEVRNTPWNERHAVDGQQAPAEKAFTFLPFNPMTWFITGASNAPAKRCTCILKPSGQQVIATLAPSRVPLTRANLRGLGLRLLPLMTLKPSSPFTSRRCGCG